MSFIILPDRHIDKVLMQKIESIYGTVLVSHGSGYPWIVGNLGTENIEVITDVDSITVIIGGPNISLREQKPAITSIISGSPWVVISSAGKIKARGNLSGTKRLFWVTYQDIVFISDRADSLADLINSSVDITRVAIALCAPVPSLPLGIKSFWENVNSLRSDECIVVNGCSVELRKWWQAPEQWATLEEASIELLGALRKSVEARTTRGGAITCDISGGLDSTSIAYLLHEMRIPFEAFSSFSSDARNNDAHWAELVTNDIGGITHHYLPSATEASTAFIVGDEDVCASSDEPLTWRSNYAYINELVRRKENLGLDGVHLNGLGGDELFTFLPGSLHAAWNAKLPERRRLFARAKAMQRWQTRKLRSALSDTHSLAEHCHKQAGLLGDDSDYSDIAFACGWSPPIHLPSYVSSRVKNIIHESLMSATSTMKPYAATHGHHQIFEGLTHQGAVIRSVAQVFGDRIRWESPFVDDAVLTARLQMVDGIAGPEGIVKPLLAQAMKEIVPARYFLRRDKGEYSSDLYREFAKHRGEIKRFFSESILVEMGLVEIDTIDTLVDRGTQNNLELFDLERAIEVERWIRTVK